MKPPVKAPKDDSPKLKWRCYWDTEAPTQSMRCMLREFGDDEPADPGTDRPALTPGLVLQATRQLGVPHLDVNIQPGGSTLVNLDTIFYAQTPTFERTVTLIGYEVDVSATPVTYTWHHGDGTSQSTTTSGRAYPAKDVTHRYVERAARVRPRVDVTYRVRYRVDGGPWQSIAETLTATGPSTDLEVREAIPLLSARG